MTEPQQPYRPPSGYGSAGYGDGSGYGPPPGYGPPAPTGYGPPTWQGPQQTEAEAKAVVALILAIAAWTPVVPFLGAIAALVLARMAKRDILRSGGAKTGLGMCRWATGLAVAHLVFVAVAVVLVALFFLLPEVLSSL